MTEAIEVLARQKSGEPGADLRVETVLERLREIDSKSHLAYVLCSVAEHEPAEGRHDDARHHAGKARGAAEFVGRKSDLARARIVLGWTALAAGNRARARAELDLIGDDLARPLEVSARVHRLAAALAGALDEEKTAG